MPQLQNLVLTDRATPAVNHTFTPRDANASGSGTVVESTGVPIGDLRATVGLTQTNGVGNYKGTVRLTLPVVQTQTINGVSSPVVVRTAYASCEFTFSPSSTEQERKDAVGMLMSALDPSKALVNDTLVKLQAVY